MTTQVSSSLKIGDFLSLRFSAGGHLVTRVVSQRAGAVLSWLAYRIRLTPNIVTALGVICSLYGAVLLAVTASGIANMLGALLLTQLGYALDCADGQLARATGNSSRRGAWWDVYCDHLVISTLSLAILFRLQALSVPTALAFVSVLAFLFGRTGALYSSTMARMWRGPNTGEAGGTALRHLRKQITLIVDTPTVLLGACLLRDNPYSLVVFATVIGVISIVHGSYVGCSATREP